jgi:hypothetical protein
MYWLESKWHYAHKLVANHFVPNLHNKPEVNHRDGNKLNNSHTNLEWVTRKENQRHMIEVLGRKVGFTKERREQSGYTVSNETKQRQRAAKIGSKHPKFKGYYCYNGVRYESSYVLAKVVGKSNRTVIRWCKASLNGFSFEPV